MTADEAETIAFKGLGFLAGSGTYLERFVTTSGVDPAALRDRAEEPDFLAAVVDFLLTDDELLLSFCAAESLDPKQIQMARLALGRS